MTLTFIEECRSESIKNKKAFGGGLLSKYALCVIEWLDDAQLLAIDGRQRRCLTMVTFDYVTL